MKDILLFENAGKVSGFMDCHVFSYINEGQTESFEAFEKFDLLAFDYYDVKSDSVKNSKIMIYIDREDLFFFCEDNSSLSAVTRMTDSLFENRTNEEALYAFFVRLLKGDMDSLDAFEQKIGAHENALFSSPEHVAVKTISELRKELLRRKRYYEQLVSIFDEMSVNDNGLLSDNIARRIAVLGTRTDRFLGAVVNLQENVTQMREAYQSRLSIKQNELMKLFTVVTVIFLPLTLIVGWYGMNFKFMPELYSQFGYPAVILVSVAIVVWLIWYFKKKKWL